MCVSIYIYIYVIWGEFLPSSSCTNNDNDKHYDNNDNDNNKDNDNNTNNNTPNNHDTTANDNNHNKITSNNTQPIRMVRFRTTKSPRSTDTGTSLFWRKSTPSLLGSNPLKFPGSHFAAWACVWRMPSPNFAACALSPGSRYSISSTSSTTSTIIIIIIVVTITSIIKRLVLLLLLLLFLVFVLHWLISVSLAKPFPPELPPGKRSARRQKECSKHIQNI